MKECNKQILQCLFWMGTGMFDQCEVQICQSGRTLCLDEDQIAFLEVLLDVKDEFELNFQISPFVKWNEAMERCARQPQSNRDKWRLVDLCGSRNSIDESLKNAEIWEDVSRESLLQALPAVVGMNSYFGIEDRKSAIRLCLSGEHGEKILEWILVEILAEVFRCAVMNRRFENVQEFADKLWKCMNELYIDDGGLEKGIERAYENICDRLYKEGTDGIIISLKYGKLYSKWKSSKDEAFKRGDAISYFEKFFTNWSGLIWIFFLIQKICGTVGIPCYMPDRLIDTAICRKYGEVPDVVRQFESLANKVIRMSNWDERKNIADILIMHLRERGMDWDGKLLDELSEKASISA